MKVFISWSKPRARAIARVLHDWIPSVLQAVEPWTSDADIGSGELWDRALTRELADRDTGLVIATPESQEAPWLNFEAGALAKALDKSRLMVLVVGMPVSKLGQPLNRFQAREFNEKDVRRIMVDLNDRLPVPLKEAQLTKALNKFWPDLESRIDELLAIGENPETQIDTDQLLEEMIVILRRLDRESTPRITGGGHAQVSPEASGYIEALRMAEAVRDVDPKVAIDLELKAQLLLKDWETRQAVLRGAGPRWR